MKKIFGAFAALTFALTLTACSVAPSETSKPASNDVVETPPVEKPKNVFAFGEEGSYENGLAVAVSTPVAYSPSDTASVAHGTQSIQVTITLTNNTSDILELFPMGSVVSAGVSADQIFDIANGIGTAPSDPILPGNSISWNEAFAVVDVNDVQYTLEASFEYTPLIFLTEK